MRRVHGIALASVAVCAAALYVVCLISGPALDTVIGLISSLILPPTAFSAESEKWPGVDDTVVGKIAKEHGRAAMTPLINTDQGDLLLFVFLLAGAVGGFAAGYFWRKLIEPGRSKEASSTGAREAGSLDGSVNSHPTKDAR
jgi:hypothetical protein